MTGEAYETVTVMDAAPSISGELQICRNFMFKIVAEYIPAEMIFYLIDVPKPNLINLFFIKGYSTVIGT